MDRPPRFEIPQWKLEVLSFTAAPFHWTQTICSQHFLDKYDTLVLWNSNNPIFTWYFLDKHDTLVKRSKTHFSHEGVIILGNGSFVFQTRWNFSPKKIEISSLEAHKDESPENSFESQIESRNYVSRQFSSPPSQISFTEIFCEAGLAKHTLPSLQNIHFREILRNVRNSLSSCLLKGVKTDHRQTYIYDRQEGIYSGWFSVMHAITKVS